MAPLTYRDTLLSMDCSGIAVARHGCPAITQPLSLHTEPAKNPSGQAIASKDNYINVSTNSLAKPVADFTVTNTYPTLNDELVKLVDLSANNPTGFQWTVSPGTFTFENSTTANSRNPELKFTALGLYSVSLSVDNANGTSAENKSNYIQVVGLNTDQNEKIQAVIYPNPSSGITYLKGLPSGTEYRVYDLNGRLIVKGIAENESVELKFTPGMYILQAHSNGSWQALGKVVINQ